MQNSIMLSVTNEQVLYNHSFQNQAQIQPDIVHSNNNTSLKQNASFALLNQLFPEQKREDKIVKQTRAILGSLISKFSTDELQEIIILFQYLSESWLNMYERDLFNGKTLQELLNLG